jgi:hypothetical protein
MLSFYFKIPFPEELEDEVWIEKYRQIEWLAEMGHLGISKEKETKITNAINR